MAVAPGDFNNDGHLDLIAANYNTRTITYYPGNGDGTFSGVAVTIGTTPAATLGISSSPALPGLGATVEAAEVVVSKTFSLTWNTGSTPAGNYGVHAIISDGQGVVSEGYATFTILPDKTTSTKIVADKMVYTANQPVALTSTVTGTSANYIFTNLTARIGIIRQQDNASVFTETKTIPILLPGQLEELKTYWNTGANPAGIYTGTLQLLDGTTLISQSTATFEILASSLSGQGLIGTLAASPNPVDWGDVSTLGYTITNKGNEDFNSLNVAILVADPDTGEVKQTLTATAAVTTNTSMTGSLMTQPLTIFPKVYVAVLQVSSATMAQPRTLASTALTVRDNIPPAVTIVSPVSGSRHATAFDIGAQATDNASGIKSLEYQIDGGQWKPLPLTDPATNKYSTQWQPRLADEGGHTINFRATDGAGNTSLPVSTTITIECLSGSLSSQPNPVYQGADETFTYAVTNGAYEPIAGLAIKILITDPDTQQISQTLEATADLPLNGSFTGNLTASTLNLSPKSYTAVLQALGAGMSAPKTLATTTFEVKPSMEASKTIPEAANLLVWINDHCHEGKEEDHPGHDDKEGHHAKSSSGDADDDKKSCYRIDLIERMLTEAAADYVVVYDKKDFQRELRNPYYTDILILGEHNPVEDHYIDELREKVYSGTGIVSSLWLRHDDDEHEVYPIFGINHDGDLSGKTHSIRTVNSPITTEGLITAKGHAERIEAAAATVIAGWMKAEGEKKESSDDDHKETKEYPAITLNEYGKGRAIYLVFDLGASLDETTYTQLAGLIGNSINHVHRQTDTSSYGPEQLVPLKITLKSLGSAFDLKVSETYPAEIRLYDPVTDKWITDNPWLLNIALVPHEEKTIPFFALTPDKAGTYTLSTEVGYLENGGYTPYQTLAKDIVVAEDAASTVTDILSGLGSLQVSKKDTSRAKEAGKHIEEVRDRHVDDQEDIEKNIHDTLDAVSKLLEITSADITQVRLLMDSLLRIWEGRWYRVP